MKDRMQLNQDVTVGPQPMVDELSELGRQGFKSVVNFRTEGEEEQPLSPADEGEQVREAGLEYRHVPVSMKSMSAATVDDFRREYENLPKPVFAHCKSGKRAGAMVMMHMACEQGMSGEETLAKAEEMGFECDQAQLRDFVKDYVDNHGTVRA